jgi:diguanylate cyclase (GGDEF)-like protein
MRQWSYTSLLMVPLFTGGQTFGVVELYRNASQPVFNDSEVQLAQSLAAQASVAIFNARLMAETRRRAEEQSVLFQAVRDFTSALDEGAIFEAIAHHMISALGLACCAISRWDKTNNQLVTLFDLDITHTFDVDETGAIYDLADYPTTRRVLETRQAAIIRITDPDVDPQEYAFIQKMGFEAVLLMPLMARKEVIGLIELYPAPGTSPFSESALQLADSLNAQAAIALDNARLHATTKEQVRDLDALLAANTALLSTLDLDPLLHNILTAAIGTIRAAEKGTILLIEPSSGQLQIRAVGGYSDPRVKNLAFASNDGYSAQAVREKRPLLISDARADSSTRYEGDIPEVRGIHSAIVAPLLLEESLLGAIALDSSRRSAFTQADLKLLVAFASTAAASINHARLHAEAQTRAATDGPTGLANRRAFDHALEAEINRAGRHGYPLSLLVLDIDSFKLYNDAFGHPAGDERIKAIADLLMKNMRGPDIAARYGGEEFAVILPHTNKSGALTLAERIRAAAQAQAPAPASGNQPVPGYTLSIGVATLPEDGLTPDVILLAADNAELASKRAGKNCVTAAPAIS